MENEYRVPEILVQMMDKCIAAQKLRDIYVKLPFCYKKALKASYDYERFGKGFWREVITLYPYLNIRELEYNSIKKCLIKIKDNKDEIK